MSKLLIAEESKILCGIFKRLLEADKTFDYDIVQTYKDAAKLLAKFEYDFSVASRTLPDADQGEVISLLNKNGIAPIVYTSDINEDFMESFEGAHIVEYVLRHRHDNVKYVISRLKQLIKNNEKTILVAHKSEIHRRFLKQHLALHNFNIIMVESAYEAIQKLDVDNKVDLLVVHNDLSQVNGLEHFNGIELVRKVRDMKKDKLNIIALASEPNSYLTTLFLNEGADDYLLENYSRDEFYVRIYQNLKKR